jgi:hypothetical protein
MREIYWHSDRHVLLMIRRLTDFAKTIWQIWKTKMVAFGRLVGLTATEYLISAILKLRAHNKNMQPIAALRLMFPLGRKYHESYSNTCFMHIN